MKNLVSHQTAMKGIMRLQLLLFFVIPCLLPKLLIEGLSSPISGKKSIKKVAIVGSGIAGLSLAHALVNSPDLQKDKASIDVSIYDSRSSMDYEAGAGVQLNGGMSVLRMINPKVQRAVADAALPLEKIQSRTKPWFGENAFDTLLEIPMEESIREQGGNVEDTLIIENEVMVYAIMRGALQEVLMNTLPTETAEKIKFGKCLVEIKGKSDGAHVCFQDGSTEGPFDLVVGCDGVNSAVKEYISTGSIPKFGTRGQQALYSGIRIKYAIQDENVSHDKGEGAILRQYFGNSAYSLAGVYGNGSGKSPTKCAFLIYADKNYLGPFKRKSISNGNSRSQDDENTDWSQDNRISTGETMLKQIKEFEVPNIDVNPIIENSNRFFELGVYFHNPLNKWTKEIPNSGGTFCTLSGDAAHAMPPFLGQGSNQAIQDGYCLAAKIYEYNENLQSATDTADMANVLKSYEKVRWKPTASISSKSFLLGYLESGGGPIGKFRDTFFKTCGVLGIAKKIYFGAAVPEITEK